MKLFFLSGIAFLSTLLSLSAQEKVNSIITEDSSKLEQSKEAPNYFLSLGLNVLDNGNSKLLFNTDEFSFNTPFFVSLERRNTTSNFAAVLSFSTNRLKVKSVDKFYYSIDAAARYYFDDYIFNNSDIETYVGLGLGRFFLENNGNNSLNFIGGARYWFSENFALSLEGNGKVGLKPQNVKVLNHYAYNLGIVWKSNSKNKVVKVPSTETPCPEVKGLKQFNGCPDTDGDGIADKVDACPDVFGLAALNGCPDTDGDGIADKDDACPDVKGLVAFKGCPDTDGDGITDKEDKCPTVAGPKSNGGCLVLDADKDGVPDKDDDCPTVAGPASNRGCPEVTPEVIEKLKIQARSVFFNSGKSTFKVGDAATIASLDAMREILKNYPNATFSIEGHTDSDGSDKFNQKLSEDRANAVRDALIEKGVKADNLTAVGFGESNPIASNKTKEGKAQNRRTEVRHVGSTYEGKL